MEVTAPADANIYINNEYGASRTYETAPEKGVIRVLVQEGEKEPYLCYITLITEEEAADVLADITQAVSVSISERTGLYVSETEYDENWDEIRLPISSKPGSSRWGREDIAVSVVESENAAIASDGTITFGEARVQGNVKFRFTKDGISYENGAGHSACPYQDRAGAD